jgi:hypothetical protein
METLLNSIGKEYHHNDEYFTKAELKKYKNHCETCDILLVGHDIHGKQLEGNCSVCHMRITYPNDSHWQKYT